jgi:hypothetical protein
MDPVVSAGAAGDDQHSGMERSLWDGCLDHWRYSRVCGGFDEKFRDLQTEERTNKGRRSISREESRIITGAIMDYVHL